MSEYGLSIKVILAAAFMWICCALTSCGFVSGSTVVGTTSFLQEVNRGPAPMDAYTSLEKRKLADAIRRY